MAHYLLTYHLAADYLARRPEFRAEHLALADAAATCGELLAGGAVDPGDGTPRQALLLFSADSPAPAEAFAAADPYVRAGLVERWTVERWLTVAGPWADAPLR